MDDSKLRMELVLSHLMTNPNELAKSLGYSRAQTVYNALSGRNGISDKLARDICEIYPNFSYQWLKTGEGSMLTEDSIVPESKDIQRNLDDIEILKRTIFELSESNKILAETNARHSRTIERLTELLYEKEAKHA